MTGHHLQRRQFTVSSRRYTLLHAGYTVARPLARPLFAFFLRLHPSESFEGCSPSLFRNDRGHGR